MFRQNQYQCTFLTTGHYILIKFFPLLRETSFAQSDAWCIKKIVLNEETEVCKDATKMFGYLNQTQYVLLHKLDDKKYILFLLLRIEDVAITLTLSIC